VASRITNTQKDMLDAVSQRVGFGGVYRNSWGGLTQKPSYSYQISGKNAKFFTEIIFSFIKSDYKRNQLLKILGGENT